jgi:hypothetical protein
MEKVVRYKISSGEEFETREAAMEAEQFARIRNRVMECAWFRAFRNLEACHDPNWIASVLVINKESLIRALTPTEEGGEADCEEV